MVRKGTKLTGKAKSDFLKRMAAGRRKTNPSRSSKTMAARKRRTPARRRKTTATRRRRRNPDMKLAGVKLGDVARTGAGVAAGAYLGGTVTSFLTSQLVSKFGASRTAQAAGFFLGGAALIWAGDVLQRRAKNLPIQSAFAAMSAPMLFRALEAAGVTPTAGSSYSAPSVAALPPAQQTVANLAGGFGSQIGMNGGLAVSPGPYPGAMASGWSPSMRGGFGSMLP